VSVTNDVQVLKKLSFKQGLRSAEVADLLGLTPFQVTARLKSMEKRELVKRDKKGNWLKVVSWKDAQAQQEQAAQAKAVRVAAWKAGLPPQGASDEGVPHLSSTVGWTGRYTPYAEDRWLIVFKSPDGVEYIRAHVSERADVIRDIEGLPSVRLVRYAKGHRMYRAVEDYHKMLERLLNEEAS